MLFRLPAFSRNLRYIQLKRILLPVNSLVTVSVFRPALRTGFKQCYQDKHFKTVVLAGDRIPNNLLMEDKVLLQLYDIASSRV